MGLDTMRVLRGIMLVQTNIVLVNTLTNYPTRTLTNSLNVLTNSVGKNQQEPVR